jgi:GAF domain-containing protein
VVKTETPLVVTDASTDPRVPRRLVDVIGITSYVGVPIRVGGQVLGSLCVADTVPRQWSAEVVGDLGALAGRVSDRLEALTALDVVDEITVVPPSSLAARASVLAQILQRSLVEVGPMVRLAQGAAAGLTPDALLRAGSLLSEASDFYDELLEAAGELCVATKRVEQAVASKPPRMPGAGDVTCQSTRR